MKLTLKRKIGKLKLLLASYIQSEGCSCCRGEGHAETREEMAKLLKIPKYEDGSGYNWSKVQPK